MIYRNDDIPLFVPFFNVAMILDDLLQLIDPVYGRFELARFDQFFEQEQVFEFIAVV